MPSVRQSIVELEPVYTQRQCAEIIAWAERQGFAPWPADADVPSLARCEANEDLLVSLWLRLSGAIEDTTRRMPLRFAGPAVIDRFDPGQRLLPMPGAGLESGREVEAMLAVVIFLNEGFVGGEFVCYPADAPLTLAARTGAGLVVPAFLTCEESPVCEGRKYVLRTTVVVADA